MQYKTLSVLLFSATALAAAAPELEKKQYSNSYGSSSNNEDSSYGDSSDSYYQSLMANLNSLETDTDYMDFLTMSDALPSGYGAYEPSGGANAMPTGSGDSNQITGMGSMPTDTPNMQGINMIPSSIESVLITAVPASYLQQMSNPSARSSLFSEIQHGNYPAWYKSLPGSVKTWLSTFYATAAMPTGAGAVTGGPSSASATAGSDGSGSDSSTSKGGAPAPTGAVAASIAGAAGILGLAIVL